MSILKKCVFLDGQLINIGDWDYAMTDVKVGEETKVITPEFTAEDGSVVPAVTENVPIYEQQATNPLPEGAVIEEREIEQDADGGWRLVTTKSLEEKITEKITELNLACDSAIVEGFTSTATGEEHKYPSDDEAQRNVSGAVALIAADPQALNALLDALPWKTYDAGDIIHTREQTVKLGTDLMIHISTNIQKYRTLKSQAEQATEEIIDSIKW